MIQSVTQKEYTMMREFLSEIYHLEIPKDGDFHIRKNLSSLAVECGCRSFTDFHAFLKSQTDNKLRDRVIAAMTMSEVSWFGGEECWTYLSEVAVPSLLAKGAYGEHPRVWSAGTSTGQEAYSLAMLIHEAASRLTDKSAADKIEILGTDISSAALFLAVSGRYDVLAMEEGLSMERRSKFFSAIGRTWQLNEDTRERVQFQLFNPVDSTESLGLFDLILCRNTIRHYVADHRKKLMHELSETLKPGGILLLDEGEVELGGHGSLNIGTYNEYKFLRRMS